MCARQAASDPRKRLHPFRTVGHIADSLTAPPPTSKEGTLLSVPDSFN